MHVDGSSLATVKETAAIYGVSESWVRRHKRELPLVPAGRLVRFNKELLSQSFDCRMQSGNSLKPERKPMYDRYQRGSVIARGKKGKRTWYGKFREDIQTPAGIERKQRLVRLGTLTELPTTNDARNKLAEIMNDTEKQPLVMDMTFADLAKRWEKAEGPTMKASTRERYVHTLNGYLVPALGKRKIADITREDIQRFLADRAQRYSTSILRSMRVAFSVTLGWAVANDWLTANPCTKIRLPKVTGGRRVVRIALSEDQVKKIMSKLKEPYATLVLLLAASGLRISEAIGLKRSDIEGNMIAIRRRIYFGDVDAPKSSKSRRVLPLHPEMIERLKGLGQGSGEWLFQARNGSALNPGNVLRRYVHPAARACGFDISGWHDFRHTATTNMRKRGVSPKVVSDILGHERVNLAMDVYDRTDASDFEQALGVISAGLVSSGIKSAATLESLSTVAGLVGPPGFEPGTNRL